MNTPGGELELGKKEGKEKRKKEVGELKGGRSQRQEGRGEKLKGRGVGKPY